jgi:hypothetical protein
MKFILLMNSSKAGVSGYMSWGEADRQAHMEYLTRLNQTLRESGEFVATQPLAPPNEAKVVRGGANGVPVTDGVFPETKEFLLGYWIVDVVNAERAYEIAGRLSAGPGPGGVPTNMPIEVRGLVDREAAARTERSRQ